ncbi:hypothetical protein HPULCUR_000729 [Helicostylum pulchrum]|uniref:STAS domain-containing protein n=1 Tax=Helicostylum pulchrum TaxID=562976 RepID=A0ABP9XKP3_9FUNG
MKEGSIVIDYQVVPTKQKIKNFFVQAPKFFKNYFANIFPILQWIHRYNLTTVSLLVSTVVNSVIKINPTITPSEVAVTLGLFAGIISIIISLLRLGMLVDFIPEPAIAGYMTGSAITIVLSQWPKLFGIPNVTTHAAPYKILGNILTNLPQTRLDVAFGLSSLVFLYGVKFICARFTCRNAILKKSVFLFGIMRNGLIVIVGTFISYLINRGKDVSPISVIQSVPPGFDHMAVPKLRFDILQEAGGVLPSIVIILILEHITVAKSFGRIYDYQVDADQEILAIGVANVVGAFFGGYPATGAFSRTAIMARSGSRTPIAGIFSGAVVVLALYALTPAFYYIPDAVLAAVVIHAVSDLVSGSKYLKELWRASTAEFIVWTSAVLVTIFVDVQRGIYAAVGLSMLIMLYRLARPPIKTLARITLEKDADETTKQMFLDKLGNKTTTDITTDKDKHYIYVDEIDPNFQSYITELPSGLLVLRLCDSILYPNAEHISEAITHIAKKKTRCGNIADMNKSNSEKTWSHSSNSVDSFTASQFPVLEALVLDFGAVCRVDSTALQNLIIVRETLDRYAGNSVEWHFTGIQSQSVRSLLLTVGFGSYEQSDRCGMSSSLSSSNNSLVSLESAHSQQVPSNDKLPLKHIVVNNKSGLESTGNFIYDLETSGPTTTASSLPTDAHAGRNINSRDNYYTPTDRYPCFHWDVDSAVRSICTRWHDQNFKLPQIEKISANDSATSAPES